MQQKNMSAAEVVTEIMLTTFRLNAKLLEKGDELVAPLNLTSARWQIIGAIALAGQPLTAPQIASAMGVTRQGAQKQLNLAYEEGLVAAYNNPRHERSPLYGLTKAGQQAYDGADTLQTKWARLLAQGKSPADLASALATMRALETDLESIALPTKEKS